MSNLEMGAKRDRGRSGTSTKRERVDGTRKIRSFSSSHQIPPAVINERLRKSFGSCRHERRKPYLTIPFAVLPLELGVNNPASDAG